MKVKIIDNTDKVMSLLEENINRTLTELGLKMVEEITTYMLTKYGKPIWFSGDLLRSITFKVNLNTKTVTIGTKQEYAEIIHEGSTKRVGRPFIKDALLENTDIWERIIKDNLGQGFKVRLV